MTPSPAAHRPSPALALPSRPAGRTPHAQAPQHGVTPPPLALPRPLSRSDIEAALDAGGRCVYGPMPDTRVLDRRGAR